MTEKKVPEIRFKGFEDEWEQRKFKEFSKKQGRKNSQGLDFPAYSVSNKVGLIAQTDQFDGSRLDDLEKSSYKFVEPNEFAYNPARINVGSIAFNNLDKTVIVSSLYVVVKMSDDLDNEFILQYIKSPIFIKEVRRNTEGSVREYLFYENFSNIKVPYTKSIEEQKLIGKLLRHLDNTIALHQRKLDLFKKMKQGYLEKMFPKNGVQVPELRFAYFIDVWEQRKFKEFSKKQGRKNSQGLDFPAYSVSNKVGLIAQTDQFDGSRLDDLEKSSYKFVEPNEFAYNPARINVGSIAFNNLDKTVIVSSLYVVVKMSDDLDNEFILQYIKSPIFIKEVRRNTEGSVREYLFYENFSNIKVPYTKSIEEQKLIGKFLRHLDNTITLHQNKLDQLQSLKYALLKRMFI
ncbi:restriction endonuclease subunit S [Enterococcus devriesei]